MYLAWLGDARGEGGGGKTEQSLHNQIEVRDVLFCLSSFNTVLPLKFYHLL